ncbi:MAG: hypothetical protein L0G39_12460, partial [Chryseobacterium sp.]|nr:hypothetical protein [Chryseobacterium sp.]
MDNTLFTVANLVKEINFKRHNNYIKLNKQINLRKQPLAVKVIDIATLKYQYKKIISKYVFIF